MPFLTDIPKTAALNIAVRQKVLRAGYEDDRVAEAIWWECSRDMLMFINLMCLAKGTLVVTEKRGPIPIQDVLASDRVWDGNEWVSHQGVIHQGRKEVIDAYGIKLTPDHKVWTKNGWKNAEDRHGREEIRLPDGYSAKWKIQEAGGVGMPVRLRTTDNRMRIQSSAWSHDELRMLEGRSCYSRSKQRFNLCSVEFFVGKVLKEEQSSLLKLRRTRDNSVREVACLRELSRRHGRASFGNDSREDRQQQWLLSRELSLGKSSRTGEQHSKKCFHRNNARKNDCGRGISNRRDNEWSNAVQGENRSNRGGIVLTENTYRSEEVYDLINCGERRAFTVLSDDGTPLLVHNCWIMEPRKRAAWQITKKYGEAKELPFITRGYQDEVVRDSIGKLGREDIIVWKSREMGMTLLYLAMALHSVIFEPHTQIGFVSKDLLTADSDKDPNSLMSMFRNMLDRLPKWMRPKYERNISQHSLVFENKSTITAYAATGDFVRGGRKDWLLMDEFHFFGANDDYAAMDASVDACNGRVIISTVNRGRGCSGCFYNIVNDPNHNGHLITLDWWQDADKAKGLYHSKQIGTTDEFRLVIDDVAFWNQYKTRGGYSDPNDPKSLYKFKLDGKKRSLYYDWRCTRPNATEASVAAEIGRKFGSSNANLCNQEELERAILRAKKPVLQADIYRDPMSEDDWRIDFDRPGNCTFWCPLIDGKPPVGKYSAGADIGAGMGGNNSAGKSKASYSALEVFDALTGEQVFEWRSNTMGTLEFASMTVFVCKLFCDSFLVPEMNGPLGQTYLKRVVDMRYTNIYQRTPGVVLTYRKTVEGLGYYNGDGGRTILLGVEDAIVTGRAQVNSVLALREMTRYLLLPGDKIGHAAAADDEDVGARGKSHGDAAIALACGWLGVEDRPVRPSAQTPDDVPAGSFLARKLAYQAKQVARTTRAYWKPW